jgi:hypothetical protein
VRAGEEKRKERNIRTFSVELAEPFLLVSPPPSSSVRRGTKQFDPI